MHEQDQVATFLDRHEMETTLAYHVLDLQSEVGEVAKEVTTSTDYGARPDEAAVADDELGDVFFSLLAVAEAADIDLAEALEDALAKYEARIAADGDAGSGE